VTSSEITQRYKSIVKRSFERHLDLFLTAQFLRSSVQEWEVSPDSYKTFQPTDQDWISYLTSHQAKSFDAAIGNSTVRKLDDAINTWWKGVEDEKQEYEQIHRNQYCISQSEFQDLFTSQPNLACEYCHITEAQLKTLIQAGQIQTKRLRTRGTTFEIDCRNPHLGYTAGNLAICCYRCNNAKTDEFTHKEFLPVAKAMGLIWQQRLGIIISKG
jgi:5-methylcytosine-specific restriction endonuclease McrA